MLSIVVRTLAFAAFAGLLFAPIERLFSDAPSERRGRLTDALFATVGECLTRVGLVYLVTPLLAAAEVYAPERPWIPYSPLGQVMEVAVGLFVIALFGYLFHRLSHHVPFLWRIHAVHHSSESLDWLAAFRRHPLDVLLTTIVQNGPVVLLGVPLGAHIAVIILLRINTVFVHSNLRIPLGPLRYLIATPDFHHRHHARSGEAKNFSSIFPFVDHLFGTASDERGDECGIDEPIDHSFVGLLVHPFRIGDARAEKTTP